MREGGWVWGKELRMWFWLEAIFGQYPALLWCTSCTSIGSSFGARLQTFLISQSSSGVSSPVQKLEWWTDPSRRHSCPRERGYEPREGRSWMCWGGGGGTGELGKEPEHVLWRSQWLSFTLETHIFQFWEFSSNRFVDNIIFSGTPFIWILEILERVSELSLFSSVFLLFFILFFLFLPFFWVFKSLLSCF